MRKAKEKSEFENMIRFQMPGRGAGKMQIQVNRQGEAYFGKPLLDVLKTEKEQIWVEFSHSEDYRIIEIKKDREEADFRIPLSGRMKFQEWKEELQNLGYGIPAEYRMGWNEERKSWIGRLQEVAEAPMV